MVAVILDKLRVGILLDSTRQAAWVSKMTDVIKSSDFAEIVLVVKVASSDNEQDYSNHSWTRRLLLAAQIRLVGGPGCLSNALEETSAVDLLSEVPTIEIDSYVNAQGPDIDCVSLQEVLRYELDVLVQVNSSARQCGMTIAAKYGIWWYEFGDSGAGRDAPPGYHELLESLPVSQSTLRICTSDHNRAYTAVQSFSSTNERSIEDNASNILWKSLYFVPRKLRELYEDGGERFFARLHVEKSIVDAGNVAPSGVHTDWQLARFIWAMLCQKIRRKWLDMFYYRQWFLLYEFAEGIPKSFEQLKPLIPPNNRLWADPFVIKRDGKYYVFFEECLIDGGKGYISVIELNENGIVGTAVPVLQQPYHLSYPFLFEQNGELYMIPETAENRTVELYRCTDFPHKWEFQKNLMVECSLVDATLFQVGGRWWMFANSVDNANASTWDELCIFYSDSPFSDDWTAHPRNPVISDVRISRPAGRIFAQNGRIYRPSQNSSRHYGYGLNISEITHLSETDYREEIVSKLEPDWDMEIISVHTINHAPGLTMIDGQRWLRK